MADTTGDRTMAQPNRNDLAKAIRNLRDNDPTGLDYSFVERANQQGWTIEKPTSLGNIVRYEGVRYSDRVLRSTFDRVITEPA